MLNFYGSSVTEEEEEQEGRWFLQVLSDFQPGQWKTCCTFRDKQRTSSRGVLTSSAPLCPRKRTPMPICLVVSWSDGSQQGGEAQRRQEHHWGPNTTRGRLGLDDRCWLFSRHHLHPGSDQVMLSCF